MNVAVLGDTNDHGAAIIPTQAGFTINGMPVLALGDQCVCITPEPHLGAVAAVGTFTINGVPVAQNGSPCTCGAIVSAITQFTVIVTP
jgi:uncharacterized Zn-binding protein involved in type VI secretion